jgi:hypothetical protein
VADGKGKVYVSLQDTNEVAQLDPQKLHLDQRWHIGQGSGEGRCAVIADGDTCSLADNCVFIVHSAHQLYAAV